MKGMNGCDVTMNRSIKWKGERWEVMCDMAEKREGTKGRRGGGVRREREERRENRERREEVIGKVQLAVDFPTWGLSIFYIGGRKGEERREVRGI